MQRWFGTRQQRLSLSDTEQDEGEAETSTLLRTEAIPGIKGLGADLNGRNQSQQDTKRKLLMVESQRGSRNSCAALAATIRKHRPQTLIVPIAPDSPMTCRHLTPNGTFIDEQEDELDGQHGKSGRTNRRRRQANAQMATTDTFIQQLQKHIDQVDIGVDVSSAQEFIEDIILPQKQYTDRYLSNLIRQDGQMLAKIKENRAILQKLYLTNPSPSNLQDITLSGTSLQQFFRGSLFRRRETVSIGGNKYSVVYSKYEGTDELHRVYEDSLSAISQGAMLRKNEPFEVIFGGIPMWASWMYLVNSRSKSELKELLLEVRSQTDVWDELYPLLCQYAPDMTELSNCYSATIGQLVTARPQERREQSRDSTTSRGRKKRHKKVVTANQWDEAYASISVVPTTEFDNMLRSHELVKLVWDAWSYDGGKPLPRAERSDTIKEYEKGSHRPSDTSGETTSFRKAMLGSSRMNMTDDIQVKSGHTLSTVTGMESKFGNLKYNFSKGRDGDEAATFEALKLYGPGVARNDDPHWYLEQMKDINKSKATEPDSTHEKSRQHYIEKLMERKPSLLIPGKCLHQGNLHLLLKACTLQVNTLPEYSKSQASLTKNVGAVMKRLGRYGCLTSKFVPDNEAFALPDGLIAEDSYSLTTKLEKFGRVAWFFSSQENYQAVGHADPVMSTDLWNWWLKPFKVFPAYFLDHIFDRDLVSSLPLSSPMEALYLIGRGFTAQQSDAIEDPERAHRYMKSKYTTLDPDERQEVNEMKNHWENFWYPLVRFRSQH